MKRLILKIKWLFTSKDKKREMLLAKAVVSGLVIIPTANILTGDGNEFWLDQEVLNKQRKQARERMIKSPE